MRVTSLHVENLLTFSSFRLRLDGERRVVVGPNGAGKSNIVRVIDLVQKAVDSVSEGLASPRFAQAADQVLRSFAAARHHGEPADRDAVVRLAIELTTAHERIQFGTYIRAAILHTLIQELSPGDGGTRLELAQWVEREISDERLSPLFSGAVVLRHAGMPHVPWEISYEFGLDGIDYAWLLAGPGLTRGIVRADSRTARLSATPMQPLSECLLDVGRTHSVPIQLPSPVPGFDLARMCPGPAAAVTEPTIHTGSGVVDQQFAPFRRAIELLGLPTPETAGQRTFPLAYVLSRILNDGVIVVGEQLRGLGTGGIPPQQPGPYSWEALVSPLRSRAPWQLPLRLFELKNGSPGQRSRFKAIQDAFTTLAPGRALDVKFQATSVEALSPTPVSAGHLAVFSKRGDDDQARSAYPAAAITVMIDRPGEGSMHPDDLPVQMHGAGTWEALVIAEALADAADRFVVLDEPAVTLHPTWQRALRSLIRAAPGQFLMITHSADLVSMEGADDLASLVRIENEAGQTRAHRFDQSSLTNDDISRITREFALSTDAVSLLFARGVVLVEGETELGALPAWFKRCAASIRCKPPGDLDLGFWSVGGDNNFRTYVAVLRALAIPWALICDGAAFDVEKRQGRHPHIFDQVLKAKVDAPTLERFMHRLDTGKRKRVMNKRMFTDERKLGAQAGIFTLARGWKTADKTAKTPNDESFEAFVEAVAPGKLGLAEADVGDSKVRRGRWLGAMVACPSGVTDLYGRLITALGQRGLTG
jgi:energy-coupling factor transporter ATP-binding protein EcfA2